jgi:hypothetical protein
MSERYYIEVTCDTLGQTHVMGRDTLILASDQQARIYAEEWINEQNKQMTHSNLDWRVIVYPLASTKN